MATASEARGCGLIPLALVWGAGRQTPAGAGGSGTEQGGPFSSQGFFRALLFAKPSVSALLGIQYSQRPGQDQYYYCGKIEAGLQSL